MKQENNSVKIEASTDASVTKKSYPNRILSVLLALLIALNAALSVFLILENRPEDVREESESEAFDFENANIKDYLAAFSAALLTGNTYAGKELALDKNVSEEDAKTYITSLFLAKATPSDGGKLNKTKPMDFADQLSFYVLYAEKVNEDGTYSPLDTEYFINAFAQSGQIQLGSAILGKEFDAALFGKAPSELGSVTMREHGYVTDGEETVLVVSYEATIDGKDTVYKTVNGKRFDTLKESGAFADALLAKLADGSNVALGEGFKLDVTHDINEDGKDELVHYNVNVNAAVTEDEYIIEATLPEDFFGKNDENYALCGTKLAFHVAALYSVAYEVSFTTTENKVVKINGFDDLTAEYISTVLESVSSTGFSTEKTEDAEVRAEYLDYYVEHLTESYEETQKTNAINLIWKNLLNDIDFDHLPEDALEELKEESLTAFNSQYEQMVYYYASYSMTNPYATIEDFAKDYFGYDTETYESYVDYIEKEHTPKAVKQELLIYAIYNSGLIEDAYGKYMKLFNEYVDAFIKVAANQGTTLSRDAAIERVYNANGGAKNVKEAYILQIVNDYLYENNQIDWELSSEDAE